MTRALTLFSCTSLSIALAACTGRQSALAPGGVEAAAVAHLFWVMLTGAALVWLAVMMLVLYAGRSRRRVHSHETGGRLILWGGAVFPVVTLTLLLAYGLWLMPSIRPLAEEDPGLRIEVSGERFWWRVRYVPMAGGPPVETANDIRIPVGERVEFVLTSPDVIHSFWIPPLGGKMDMIPGRTNRLTLEADRPGSHRGVCAEFCGTSHALMAFTVEAMEREAFDTWLKGQARPVAAEQAQARGHDVFMAQGCNACHTIRGTEANGVIGPDLTHLADRPTLAAGIIPNEPDALARFIREPDWVKPDVHMPGYGMLPDADLDALVAYLGSLR
ncbi:cytochrome c oxidase subunit II [Marinivivus vitaminiproducens]|uniref:cytochrome c oxidase subunit II n=1 Tax=Marinivivus vitaminiproducens TaxID=3035935 RepID=UPI0027A52A2C|nr:cytochrome c oxidase subunit II [Geminicoccaceae bacterium SCSIO 64248]